MKKWMIVVAALVLTVPVSADNYSLGGPGPVTLFGTNQSDVIVATGAPHFLVEGRGSGEISVYGATNGFLIAIGGYPFINKIPPTGNIPHGAWEHERDHLTACVSGTVALQADDGDDVVEALCGNFFIPLGEGEDTFFFLSTTGVITALDQDVNLGLRRVLGRKTAYGLPHVMVLGYEGLSTSFQLETEECEDSSGRPGTFLFWDGLRQGDGICFVGSTPAQVLAITYQFSYFFPKLLTADAEAKSLALGAPEGNVGLDFAGWNQPTPYLN